MERRTELGQAVNGNVTLVQLAGVQLPPADSEDSLAKAALCRDLCEGLQFFSLVVPRCPAREKNPVAQVELEYARIPGGRFKRSSLEAVEGQIGFGSL